MRLIIALIAMILTGIHAVPVAERISSYPFVSGDTFRAFADHIIDETGVPFSVDSVKQEIFFL